MNDGRLRDGDRLLFIGDSITDAGRNRDSPNDLGNGFVKIISECLADETNPDVTVINRGIGGNRAVDLQSRWDRDCIAGRPDVLTILVGVNDTWRRFDEGRPTTTLAFGRSMDDLVTRALHNGVRRLVLIEPFTLPVGVVTPVWVDDLTQKTEIIRALAEATRSVLLPAATLFSSQARNQPAETLLSDGVHPTRIGHNLLARAWLDLVVAGRDVDERPAGVR